LRESGNIARKGERERASERRRGRRGAGPEGEGKSICKGRRRRTKGCRRRGEGKLFCGRGGGTAPGFIRSKEETDEI
jgi:hypothetical protein